MANTLNMAPASSHKQLGTVEKEKSIALVSEPVLLLCPTSGECVRGEGQQLTERRVRIVDLFTLTLCEVNLSNASLSF